MWQDTRNDNVVVLLTWPLCPPHISPIICVLLLAKGSTVYVLSVTQQSSHSGVPINFLGWQAGIQADLESPDPPTNRTTNYGAECVVIATTERPGQDIIRQPHVIQSQNKLNVEDRILQINCH